jgi:2-octaprenyl-6-methoxyphenol hydroxylase
MHAMPENDPRPVSEASLNSRPLPREGGRGKGSPFVGKADDGDLADAIVGAGPVGLAPGLALAQAGIVCRILDARPRGAVRGDRRVLALSHGSRQTLERLGAWQELGATPITSIHVSQQGGLGRTLLRAEDAGLPALGYVTEAGALGAALDAACERAGVAVLHEARVDGVAVASQIAAVRCATAQGDLELTARLVAWAEGAIESSAGIVSRDYGQLALATTLTASEPHEGRAWERFTPAGPIALLPHGRDLAAVMAVAQEELPALLALDDAAFLSRLHQAFAGRLEFVAASSRIAFPLGLRYRRTPVGERSVWLGNAAQTLHPVAGQGFNLALRDVAVLARLLREHAGDPGSAALLSRYAAARRLDRGGTIAFTDSLIRLFGGDNALLRHARGAGLALLDLLPPARSFLARRMIFGARAF